MATQDATKREPRQPGSATGKLVIHAEDDEHLADFAEYLPPVLTDYSAQRDAILPRLTLAQMVEQIQQRRESGKSNKGVAE